MAFSVTNDFTNGTLTDGDEVNTNFADVETEINWHRNLILPKLNSFGRNAQAGQNIAVWSSTSWSSESRDTTDAGATSSSGGYSSGAMHNVAVCHENRAKAMRFGYKSATLEFTTNSGSSWSAETTPASNLGGTGISGVSYEIEGRAYLYGVATSGSGLWYSTDYGDTWTQGTGAGATIVALAMYDSTHGLAIDSDENIWYTTDGTSWTDSTHNSSLGFGTSNNTGSIVILSAGASITDFTALIVGRNSGSNSSNGAIEYYDGTGVPTRCVLSGVSADRFVGNLVKLTNGIICVPRITEAGDGTNIFSTYTGLVFTDDNGLTWYSLSLGPAGAFNTTNSFSATGDSLIEYDANKILVHTLSGGTYQIDFSNFDMS